MKKYIAILLAAALCLSLGACAGGAAAPEAADGGIVLTDMVGHEVKLAAPAEKIVVIQPGDCEILYAIGGGEKLVGRGEYCDWPEEAASVAAVQAGDELNLEQIIALEPNLVVLSVLEDDPDNIAALEGAGIAVAVSDADTIEGTYEAIEMIGSLAGKEAEAAALVESMKASFAAIETSDTGKTVYFEVSPLEWGLWAAGKNTFLDELAAMMGLTNIFEDVEGWAEVSQEQVIQRNPDYIFTVTMYYGEGPTPDEEIRSRAGWEGIAAVKEGKVFQIDSDSAARPGPRLTDAAEEIHGLIGD